jgi:anti-sigma regulatory factor (Ser/Thr protein kinase)
VQVTVRVSDGWAEMTVLDRGRVQRPSRAWDEEDRSETEGAPASGRGLWLMGRLVDEVRLERLHPHGTRVTLRRRVRVPAAAKQASRNRPATGPITA